MNITLEGRVADLEHRWKIYEVHAQALGAQLERIEALESALAKQRAVNEAFMAWCDALAAGKVGWSLIKPLAAALREALK